ncbi:Arv1-domain-containing protein [Aspergillus campestris IBT 28561]|uniref:Protein ARV n=1 Tax=Aspergillus campestris (strain IBT 28561) TaxID=1392248 RepID=A0A2I1CUZ6_ASPC2|nr:Arv1-domain-containing protein [Aspergillus campestris IBT 28561]PKY01437.1 Arv1-domain-containing protein [Aspergillus campestris IBT 28561]
MPICIECSYPVSHLYSTYSRADDRSLGKGVRLTQCPRCQRFADKYVEYDFVVLFIDLVLIKPQVYRHLLFNRLGGNDNQLDRSILRLGILLLLFDVYLTWARLEKSPTLGSTFLLRAPIVIQYLFFLSLNTLATLAHHLTVRFLASILAPTPRGHAGLNKGTGAGAEQSSVPSTPVLPSFPAQPTQTPPSNSALSPPKPTPNQSSHDISSPPAGSNNNNNTTLPASTAPGPPPRPSPLRRTSTAPTQNIQPLPPPSPASPAAISTALLVSSCVKLFPILLRHPDTSSINSINISSTTAHSAFTPIDTGITHAIPTSLAQGPPPTATASPSGLAEWFASPPLLDSFVGLMPASVVELIGSILSLGAADTHLVLLSNIEALYILLGCGYVRAMALAVAGLAARWTVQRVILGFAGVG